MIKISKKFNFIPSHLLYISTQAIYLCIIRYILKSLWLFIGYNIQTDNSMQRINVFGQVIYDEINNLILILMSFSW